MLRWVWLTLSRSAMSSSSSLQWHSLCMMQIREYVSRSGYCLSPARGFQRSFRCSQRHFKCSFNINGQLSLLHHREGGNKVSERVRKENRGRRGRGRGKGGEGRGRWWWGWERDWQGWGGEEWKRGVEVDKQRQMARSKEPIASRDIRVYYAIKKNAEQFSDQFRRSGRRIQ